MRYFVIISENDFMPIGPKDIDTKEDVENFYDKMIGLIEASLYKGYQFRSFSSEDEMHSFCHSMHFVNTNTGGKNNDFISKISDIFNVPDDEEEIKGAH